MRGMRWEAQVDWPTLSPSHGNEISGGGEHRSWFLQLPARIILIGQNRIGKTQEVLMTLLKSMESPHLRLTNIISEEKWHCHERSLYNGWFYISNTIWQMFGLRLVFLFTLLFFFFFSFFYQQLGKSPFMYQHHNPPSSTKKLCF